MFGLLPPLTVGGVDRFMASTAGWALAEDLAAAEDLESDSDTETIFSHPFICESFTPQSSHHCLQQTLWGPALLYRPRGTPDVGRLYGYSRCLCGRKT